MRKLAFAFLLCCSTVLAQTPPAPDSAQRTIDMTTVIVDIAGKPVIDTTRATPDDPNCTKCGPLTLGTVVAASLLAERKEETNLSTVDKAKRGALAVKVMDNKAAVLTSAQIAEILKLMSIWSTLVVTRAVPLLDPNIDLSTK